MNCYCISLLSSLAGELCSQMSSKEGSGGPEYYNGISCSQNWSAVCIAHGCGVAAACPLPLGFSLYCTLQDLWKENTSVVVVVGGGGAFLLCPIFSVRVQNGTGRKLPGLPKGTTGCPCGRDVVVSSSVSPPLPLLLPLQMRHSSSYTNKNIAAKTKQKILRRGGDLRVCRGRKKKEFGRRM
jgi:hypothetical protein